MKRLLGLSRVLVIAGCASAATPPAPGPAAPTPVKKAGPAVETPVVPSEANEGAAPEVRAPEAPGTEKIASLCAEVEALYRRNKWAIGSALRAKCSRVPFKVFGESVQGRPLVYFEAGSTEPGAKTNVLMCGIHGDELPSLPMCLNLIKEIRTGTRPLRRTVRLFVIPLLNPDGMLATKPTRQNARGVDINRNFPTKDFAEKAVSSWRVRDRGDPRKFPGETANSEPETQAFVKFLDYHQPQKIIALHTPLGFLDLDARGTADEKRRAQFLAINMSKNAGNFTFKTFGSYPGSLGNYAGNERKIPVYTVELPPGSGPSTVDNYWKRFRVALWRAIDFDLETGQFIDED